jgi:hypothetical protein
MTAKTLRLDYFKIYDVVNQPVGDKVTLQGQFDEESEIVRVLHLEAFGNAAMKNNEAMFDRLGQLAWHTIFDFVPEPTRQVVVDNQFGEQKLIIGEAIGLLAPARSGIGAAKQLDHFKIYRVLDGAAIGKVVKVQDRFRIEKVKVDVPIAFAVPVTKEHGGATFTITNKKAHLVIYRTTVRPIDKGVRARDQFGTRDIRMLRSVALAAPSLKTSWKLL